MRSGRASRQNEDAATTDYESRHILKVSASLEKIEITCKTKGKPRESPHALRETACSLSLSLSLIVFLLQKMQVLVLPSAAEETNLSLPFLVGEV